MKIGIIGFGAIGFDVAKKLDQEKDQFNVCLLYTSDAADED